MDSFDVDGGFDVHDYRHGLKLRSETRETMTLANRADFACPACGDAFEALFVSERRSNTFDAPGSAFCVVRTDDELLLLTH